MKPKRYPSDLTRTRWKRLQPLLPPALPGGRPREVDLREVLNGIFYIARGGCSWRMMPTALPPWSTCYDYFRKWRKDGHLADDQRPPGDPDPPQEQAEDEPEPGDHRHPER